MGVIGSDTRQFAEAEREAAEARARLRETSVALLDASQSLAQIPLLELRLEERRLENVWLVEERAGLEEQIASLQARLDAIAASRSWRVTAPLRRAKSLLRRR